MEQLLFIGHIISGDVEAAKLWGLAIGMMAVMVLAASLMDLYFGIKASRAAGQFKTTSYGLRATAEKDVTYLMLYFLAAFIDACLSLWLKIPIACVLVAVGEIAIEAVSVWENRKRIKDGKADPLNVAKAMAKSIGIKDAHKIELLYETIRKEIEKEKGNVGGSSDGENAAEVHGKKRKGRSNEDNRATDKAHHAAGNE